jgi:hypothetical protein
VREAIVVARDVGEDDRRLVAYVALNEPTWADFIVRTRTAVADDVDVFHYATPIRVDGIRTELYTFPPQGVAQVRRVRLPAAEGGHEA